MTLLVIFCALLGLAVGSFVNVVVWRVPRGLSVVRPPSACPVCGIGIRPRDNVPVVGWVLLKGRCRDCSIGISPRYPAVEATCAALFAVLAMAIGIDPALPAYLYLAAVGLALALIDIDTRRLPDVLTLPSYGVVLALVVVAAPLEADGGHLLRAVLGGIAMFLFYFALCMAYPKGMGFGDVKLSGILGLLTAWLGWGAWAVGLFGGFLFGGLWGVALIAAGRAGRKSKVPFGPFMLVGALFGVVLGQPLAAAYLRLTVG